MTKAVPKSDNQPFLTDVKTLRTAPETILKPVT